MSLFLVAFALICLWWAGFAFIALSRKQYACIHFPASLRNRMGRCNLLARILERSHRHSAFAIPVLIMVP